jgi:hypothetical protein
MEGIHLASQAGRYSDTFWVFLSLSKQMPKECLEIEYECARFGVLTAVILRIHVS